jgi:hypothetical protein
MSQTIVLTPRCAVSRRATPCFSSRPAHVEPSQRREKSTSQPIPLLWLTKRACGTREATVTLSLNGRFYIDDDPIPYEAVEATAETNTATLVHLGAAEEGHCQVVMPFRYYWDLYEWYESFVPPLLFFLGDTLTADLLARRVHFGSAESARVFKREYPQWTVTHE